MQKLIIAGTVGRDAELRTTQGGDKVLGFSVAVDNGKDQHGNKRPATWYDCSIWGKRAESLAGYIRKGERMTLEGRPAARAHDGKAYLGLSVSDFTFQGGTQGGGQQNSGYDDNQSGQQNGAGGYGGAGYGGGYGAGGRPGGDMGEEIPFAPEFRA